MLDQKTFLAEATPLPILLVFIHSPWVQKDTGFESMEFRWCFVCQHHNHSLERISSRTYALPWFQCWSEFHVMKALEEQQMNLLDWEQARTTQNSWNCYFLHSSRKRGKDFLVSGFLCPKTLHCFQIRWSYETWQDPDVSSLLLQGNYSAISCELQRWFKLRALAKSGTIHGIQIPSTHGHLQP